MTPPRENRTQIIQQLDQASVLAGLPEKVRARGDALLAQLRRPVRIGLFGLPDSSTTDLLNGLLEQTVLPHDALLPPTELGFADTPSVTLTMPDGRDMRQAGGITADTLAHHPLMLWVDMPAPLLRDKSILSIIPEAANDEMEAALRWGAPRCDLVVWCTSTWSPSEQAAWRRVFPEMHRHAALVVMRDPSVAPSTRIGSGIDDGFEAVLPIVRDPSQARMAAPLRAYLTRLIEDARAEDMYAAMMYLKRYAPDIQAPLAADPSPVADPQAEVQNRVLSRFVAGDPAQTQDPAQSNPAALEKLPKTVSQPRSVVPLHGGAPATGSQSETPGTSPEATAALARLFHYLRTQSHALFDTLVSQPNVADAEQMVLQGLETTLDCLLGQIEADDRLCETWPQLRRSLEEAQELSLLLRLEGGPAQAQEAAALLVQLRGDVERELAA